ncbi:MAG: hypothetical protein IJ449_09420 [Clostridia bacterium]|nr:hypothetical protein [Clostridia bacterium]
MRAPVPEHKTVYLRFHKRIDELLTAFSAQTGMRRATAVVWIQNRYMTKLTESGIPVSELTADDLGFTGIEEPYFITLGRGSMGSMLGRAMQLTVDRHAERTLELVAMQCGITTRNFRTAILVQYFAEIGLI